jgi:hypothetical protein
LFILLNVQSISAIYDLRVVKNLLIINSIKEKIANSKKKLPDISSKNVIFILNLEHANEIIVSFTIISSDCLKFINKVIATVKIKNYVTFDEILEFMTLKYPEEKPNLNFKYEISDFKFLKPDNNVPYVSLLDMKLFHGLGNYIDLEKKDGRVFYTVPSEDKLDDIHMVYESGNERKEFVFTNSPEKPIVPVEEVEKLGKKPEVKPKKTIMSQISSFFGFFTKHEEVKNEGYDYVDEHTKLKEKIY